MSPIQILALVCMCVIVLIFFPVYVIYISKAWYIGKFQARQQTIKEYMYGEEKEERE
jgi:hypothetical protein